MFVRKHFLVWSEIRWLLTIWLVKSLLLFKTKLLSESQIVFILILRESGRYLIFCNFVCSDSEPNAQTTKPYSLMLFKKYYVIQIFLRKKKQMTNFWQISMKMCQKLVTWNVIKSELLLSIWVSIYFDLLIFRMERCQI